MTTAHRPTFDPARGQKNTQISGSIVHTRMLPAHTTLKFRQKGQGGAADQTEDEKRDFKAELVLAEQRLLEEKEGKSGNGISSRKQIADGSGEIEKRSLVESRDGESDSYEEEEQNATLKRRRISATEDGGNSHNEEEEVGGVDEEDVEERRKRILEENRDADADSSDEEQENPEDEDDDDDDDDDDEDEDETALLMRELEKIKKEKALEKQRQEEIAARKAEEEREQEIAYGNPLLNPSSDSSFNVRRGWTEDTVFKNQASGLGAGQSSNQRGLMNDLLRSDFHRKFMDKYIK